MDPLGKKAGKLRGGTLRWINLPPRGQVVVVVVGGGDLVILLIVSAPDIVCHQTLQICRIMMEGNMWWSIIKYG